MRIGGTNFWAALILGYGIWMSTPARAVILGGIDGSGNTTAPADDPGWDRVGTVNGDSAVYLGDGFVLSAKHVDAGNLTLNGITYSVDSSYAPQYFQTQSSPQEFADLVIFKILNGPSMNFVPIWTGSGETGTTATFIGFGLDRGTEVLNQGWDWGTSGTKRWGQNVIDGTQTVTDPFGNFSYTALVSDFDRVVGGTGLANECTAAFGDSGGAMFIKSGSTWKLAGIMTAVSETGHAFYDSNTALPRDQPDHLYSVRLSDYSSWILATIPEPGTWTLMLLGGGLLGAHLLRRRK